MSDTMTVTVRDRSREDAYHYGPYLKTVTISTTCPVCGGPRGEPRGLNQCDDGEWYHVNIWTNPCGHVDDYASVLREAEGENT